MAFTAKLGTSSTKCENIVLGFGASPLPNKKFSGLYTIVSGKTNDTLYLSISYPEFVSIIVEIPNPFIETGLIGENPVTLGAQK